MTTSAGVEALAAEFVDQAKSHASARLAADANRAAKRLASIYRELRGAGSSGQSKLQELCEHDDESVRLWAATYTLQLAPAVAQPALEALAAGAFGPTRAAAASSLREWRAGRLRFP